MNNQELKFDYSFHLKACKIKTVDIRKILSPMSPFGSLVYEALECNRNAFGTSCRFKRTWTETQFALAVANILKAGYRLDSIHKVPAPLPGIPVGEEIPVFELYDFDGLTVKIKK
jgi:hypothetical protein